MANPIHRINIVAKDKRSQRKVADSTTKLDKTERELGASARSPPLRALAPVGMVARRSSGRMGFPSRCGLAGVGV